MTSSPTDTKNTNPVQAARALLKQLEQDFPVIASCQPLALGVDKQLRARIPGLDRNLLRIALRIHTGSVRYLKTLETAQSRVDLDGQLADEITDAHRAHASQQLRERFQKAAQRKKEAEQEKQRAEKLRQLAEKFSPRR